MSSCPKPSALEETAQEVQELEGARVMATWSKAQSRQSKSPCAPHRQHYAGVMARATACSWIRSEKHGM